MFVDTSISIQTAATPEPSATIDGTKLATLRAFLMCEGSQIGTILIDPNVGVRGGFDCLFEARVAPLALAVFARLLNYDDDVISVIEAAQFEGRRLLVTGAAEEGHALLTVSPHMDVVIAQPAARHISGIRSAFVGATISSSTAQLSQGRGKALPPMTQQPLR